MKKKLLTGLLLSFVFCQMLAGCGQSDEDFEGGEFSEEAPELDADDENVADYLDEDFNSTISYEDFDYISQVQFLAEHGDWLSFNDKATYAFCDMDHNGKMEVIVCQELESGEADKPRFYEISDDYETLEECAYETNCYIYDINKSKCEGLYVISDDQNYYYLMKHEYEYQGQQLVSYYCLILGDDKAVSQQAICGKNPDGYYNSTFDIFTDTEMDFEEEIKSYFEGYTKLDTPSFVFDPLEGDGFHEKITNSIRVFTEV